MVTFNSKYASSPSDLPTLDETIFDRVPDTKQRLYHGVPKLMVAWDTETTGLPQDNARPISYGIAVYRNGIHQPDESHHFLTINNEQESPMTSGAFNTHLIPRQQLKDSYNGNITRDVHGNSFVPALHRHAAATKALQILGHYQKQGAVFLGHNLGFDWEMLHHAHDDAHDYDPSRDDHGIDPTGFDIEDAKKRTIDTMDHARLRQEGPINPVSGKRINNLTALCNDQGIKTGDHSALGDSRAAAELFINQVRNNIRENRPSMQRMASTGESGIDYKKISPFCKGKNCPSCIHIDQADAANRDEMGKAINQRHDEIIKNVRIMHHNVEGLKKGK
jgi:DNA polymerase III epsilon subunit-like protein